jgi:KDO2-lipid IV(A) lauroyltransferase
VVKTETNITWVDRFLKSIAWFFNHLPRPWAITCGRILGVMLSIVFPYRKDVARSNLRLAFPDYSSKQRRDILRRTYQHFGVMLVDFFRIPSMTQDELVSIIEFNDDQIRKVMKGGQGALIMSAHIGNWELIVPMLVKNGYPLVPIMVSQRGPGGLFIKSIRDSIGSQWISKKASARTMLRLLREGKFLGLAGDQDSRKSGIWVTFFGQPASRPRGGAVFAIQSGAPMLAGWCILMDDNHYQLNYTPIPTENLSIDREEATQELIQRYISALEAVIRQYPNQYFWFHRMWKTKPVDQ